jgi:hypothetical protein
VGGADGFLGGVVEVVSERSDLGFQLGSDDEASSVDDEHVPHLGGAEVTGQCERNATIADDLGFFQAVGP